MASKRLMSRRTLAVLFSLALVVGLVVPTSYAVSADEVDDMLADYELVAVQGAGIKTADNAADQDLRFYTTLMADVENLKTDFGADEVTITEYGTIFKPTQKLAVDEALTLESEGIAVAKATGSWSDADLPEGFYAVLSDSADGVHAGVRVTARSYVTFAMESIGGTIEKTVYSNNNDEDTIINGQASRSVYMVARAMLAAIQKRAEEIAAMDVTINWTDAVGADSDPANVAGADILAFLSGNVEAAEILPNLPDWLIPEGAIVLDDCESYETTADLAGRWYEGPYPGEEGTVALLASGGGNDSKAVLLGRKTASYGYSFFALDVPVKVTVGSTFSFWVRHDESINAKLKLVFYDAANNELGSSEQPLGGMGVWTQVNVPITFAGTIYRVRFKHNHDSGNSNYVIDDIYVTGEGIKLDPPPKAIMLDDFESYVDNDSLPGSWEDYGDANAKSKVTLSKAGGITGNALALQRWPGHATSYSLFTLDKPVKVQKGDIFSFYFFHTETVSAKLGLTFYDADGNVLGSYNPDYCFYKNDSSKLWDEAEIPYRTWVQVKAPITFDGTIAKVRLLHAHGGDSVFKLDDVSILSAVQE